MLGKVVPTTLVTLTFPTDFHEIHIVKSPPSVFIATSDIITGLHLRFKYREDINNALIWKSGFVRKVDVRNIHFQLTDSMSGVSRANRRKQKFSPQKISNCEIIPMLQKHEFADDWEDAKLKNRKIPFVGIRTIKDKKDLGH